MEQHIVGTIERNDVIYIPARDMVFCKNTALSFPLIKKIIKGAMSRSSIPEKKLIITKDNGIVSLGCLTTTMTNLLNIEKNINKINNAKKL